MIAAGMPMLACPHCGADLAVAGSALACPRGHRYDVARQGYVNLLTGAGDRGLAADTAAMVAARVAVQSAGHHAPIAEAIVRAATPLAARLPPGGILDVGGGTGYHAAAVLDALPQRVGLSLDLSRYASRRAARAHPRLAAAVADAWARLPVRTASAALVLSVFAPRSAAEVTRVLAPGGSVILVTPRPGHLGELRALPGVLRVDPRKQERLAARFAAFDLVREETVRAELEVDPPTAARFLLMGPSAHHLGDAARDPGSLVAQLDTRWPDRLTIEVRVAVYAGAMEEETLDVLQRWEDCGAVWRVLSRTESHATIGLFRCDAGEELGRLRTTDPDVIAYLRSRPTSEDH